MPVMAPEPTARSRRSTRVTVERVTVSRVAPRRGGADEDAAVLARLVFETATGLRRAVVPSVERDHGLPQQSLDVLARLAQAKGGRLRMSDLAAQTMLTPSGLTRAVDRLCEAGLARRQVCTDDGRGAFAALTGEGAARAKVAMSCHRAAMYELFGEVLDAVEQERLASLLRRLRDHLDAASPTVADR
jgi:DNA-binding MarR family transcriptional regulator